MIIIIAYEKRFLAIMVCQLILNIYIFHDVFFDIEVIYFTIRTTISLFNLKISNANKLLKKNQNISKILK